jgi:uncharacterized protein
MLMGKLERLGTKVFLFIIVSGIINFYVLSRLFTLFDLTKGIPFIISWLFLSISYILAAELLRLLNNDIIKSISAVFSTWLGASFIFLWSFGILDIIGLFVDVNFMLTGRIVFVADLILIGYSIYNATTFSVRTIRIESDKLKKSFKIVQLSDLHIGAAHKQDFLQKTVDIVNKLNPHFIVFTGDLIDGVHPYRGNEFECLNQLKAPVFFTLGNHERFIDIIKVNSLLNKTNMTILRNESVLHENIQIIGIDDTSNNKEFMANFSKIKIDNEKFTILLYHRPDVFNEILKSEVDLMLSGHTHGGQLFPLNIILSAIDGPVYGIHRKNNTILYVSNGTGWWGPPMRLGSRNEITIIELISLNPEQEINSPSLETKLSDLLEEKEKEESEFSIDESGITNKKHKKFRLPKIASVLSLNRGRRVFTASKEEDLFLTRLNDLELSRKEQIEDKPQSNLIQNANNKRSKNKKNSNKKKNKQITFKGRTFVKPHKKANNNKLKKNKIKVTK